MHSIIRRPQIKESLMLTEVTRVTWGLVAGSLVNVSRVGGLLLLYATSEHQNSKNEYLHEKFKLMPRYRNYQAY